MACRKNNIDLFLFSGESSGDVYGAKLIEALKEKSPDIKIGGVGGPLMRKNDFQCVMEMEEFQIMGFIDVFSSLPSLIKKFYFIGKTILQLNPKFVVLIDYPGFNLRMARYLSKKKFSGKICQYICPSVWAWGKNRISLMQKHLDLLISFLPFERNYFNPSSLKVEYVGHPLVKNIQNYPYQQLQLPTDKKVISIFPGSRRKEIFLNLPIYLKVIKRHMAESNEFTFAISISNESFRPLILELIRKENLPNIFLVDRSKTYELMKQSFIAWAKSGTVILELALHRIPTVVTYGISPMDLFVAKNLLRISLAFYSLPNIISNSSIFPELIGPNFNEKTLYDASHSFLTSENLRKSCREKCSQLYTFLSDKDPQNQAAEAILLPLESSRKRLN